jgi:MFS family permease
VTGPARGNVGVVAGTGQRPGQSRRNGLIFTALMAGVLGYTFAQAMVAPALPVIQGALGASVSTTAFVLTAFLLTASVATPIVGSLADMFGKKRMLLLALYALAAGLLVCALGSESIGLLIAGRALQGISAGAVPVAFSVIREQFPEPKVPLALGAVSAGFGIGGGAGVVAAGLIVDRLGYTWIFWVGLVVAAACVLAAHLWVPPSRDTRPARVDWLGAALLAGWLAALLLALGQGDSWGWTSPGVLALVIAAGVLLVAWIGHGTRASAPMVDMRIMAKRTVLLTNIASVVTGFGLFAAFELVPVLVEAPPATGYGFASSATGAGLFQLPQSVVLIASGPLGGQLGARLGFKVPLALGSVPARSGGDLRCQARVKGSLLLSGQRLLRLDGGVRRATAETAP